MTTVLMIYLVIINIITFFLYGADKLKAVHHKWRIPESALILFSWIGGGTGALTGMRVFHHKTRKWKFRIIVPLSLIIWILAVAFFMYTGNYYHAGEVAEHYIHSDAAVTVTEEKTGYLFDGPGTDDLIIFYPGAKVETEAYAPILHEVAECGYDCFLVNMPFRLAFFGLNKAEDVMARHPDYVQFYMAGHSLGGAMAGNFTAEHLNEIRGVIFMAAYPTKTLEGSRALSLYGSQDGVLNMKHYQDSLSLMPDDFTDVIIEGGNHAQFGDYGEQKGDGEATISAEEQWGESVTAIMNFMEKSE
ncbi:MAG: DUF1294 domain-containing protein [Bilifractor sp.]|nr:DUF1294 domain-containing protein [Bilifractor sp.]